MTSVDPDRLLMDQIARTAREAVIDALIRKAQKLPHHGACLAPNGQPCLCFTDQVVAWLKEQRA